MKVQQASADEIAPRRAGEGAGTGPVLVDAHVHLYPAFAAARFLDAALGNVARAAVERGLPEATPGVLLFAETAAEDAFSALAERAAAGGGAAGWCLQPTAEAGALAACRDGRQALWLIAGRQIVTAEGLEVLALASPERIADGLSLDETLKRVRAADALPVLPWGFGKWLGRRGALVAERLRAAAPGALFLGDNGGRTARRPSLLAEAEARGLVVLPGSDPLPLAGQEARVASFGFVLDTPVEPERPVASLKARLRALAASPPTYGQVTRPVPFVRNQIAMQLRKQGIIS